jgi:cyclase
LVKTLKFADAKYVGDPINAIRIFNDKEVDELMVLDITASKDKKEPNYELIEQFASECFMPLTYGGGIKTMEQAQRLFNSGIEKICLQTSVLDDLSLVKSLSDKWGSSSILVSIDVKRNWMGQPKLYSAATGKTLDKKWTDYMLEAVKAGAGEIVLNAVDKDGTMKGMDTELINEAAKILSVPLVAVGGAGSLADIKAAVDAGANAVSAGALFVFQGPHRAVLITYPKYNELIQLLS